MDFLFIPPNAVDPIELGQFPSIGLAFPQKIYDSRNVSERDLWEGVRKVDQARNEWRDHYQGPATNGRGAGRIDVSLSPKYH